MPLYTKTRSTTPNSEVVNTKLAALCVQQNDVLAATLGAIAAGVTTASLADVACSEAGRLGVALSFRSALDFPHDISVCRESELINGVPGDAVIRAGEIVKVSLGLHDGDDAFTSQSWTVLAGYAHPTACALVASARECLDKAVAACRPGVKLSEVFVQAEDYAVANDFYLSPLFVGSMAGARPNLPPLIRRPSGLVGEDFVLTVGTAVSVFVMLHPTRPRLSTPHDKWTVKDRERRPSAYFSHIVQVTEHGPQILTATYPTQLAVTS